jgi:hypothetical protein
MQSTVKRLMPLVFFFCFFLFFLCLSLWAAQYNPQWKGWCLFSFFLINFFLFSLLILIFFFYLVIRLSWHRSQVWRVNPVNSDFFSFFFISFFLHVDFFSFVFFFLINLFNYHLFMIQPTPIKDYWIWYCSQIHLNLGHSSLMLL